jgi:hypothetical protein
LRGINQNFSIRSLNSLLGFFSRFMVILADVVQEKLTNLNAELYEETTIRKQRGSSRQN